VKKENGGLLGRSLIYLVNKLWLMLATLIILIAVGFTLLRILLPQIDYFKEDFERWIEQNYQVEVSVGNIEARWGPLGPVVSAKDFLLKSGDEQQDLISIDSFSVHLDGLSSLLAWQPITDRIEISGASLSFVIGRKLGVRFDTLKKEADSGVEVEIQQTSQLLLNTLFGQKQFDLRESTITLKTLSGRRFNYRIDEFSIHNYGDIHQLAGELLDDNNGQIKLVAEINGEPSSQTSETNLYLEGRDIELSLLPFLENYPHLKPASGNLNWRLWGDWRETRWQSAVGDISLSDVEWRRKTKEGSSLRLADIEAFDARFQWQFSSESEGDFRLDGVRLKQKEKDPVALPELYFLYRQFADEEDPRDLNWDLIAHDFQIDPLVEYLDVIFQSDSQAPQRFKNASLSLQMDHLGVRLKKSNGVWYLPRVNARFSELNYESLLGLPIFNGASGELSTINGDGYVSLKGDGILLDFQSLFRRPLQADKLDVALNWRTDTKLGLALNFDRVYLRNPDLTLNAKGRYHEWQQQPFLSLYAEVSQVDVSQKSSYLPAGIMTESLTRYLDNSVKSGQIPLIKAVVHGPLAAFPYANEEGLFSILANLENATYKYLPDWPQAEDLDARLLFEGNGMDLRALGGSSMGNRVKSARAVIKDFSADNTPFELYLDVLSRNNQGRNFLSGSPLADLADSLGVLDLRGELQTGLSLKLGLTDPSNARVQGKVTPLQQSTMLRIDGMLFKQVTGDVLFDESGLRQSTVKARYHEGDIKAVIQGTNPKAAGGLTIDIEGELNADALVDFVGARWAQFAQGSTSFSSQLQIPAAGSNAPSLFKLTTGLEGIEINLPDEFAKPANSKTPLSLGLEIAADDQFAARINWRDLKGEWQWRTSDQQTEVTGGVFYYRREAKITDATRSRLFVDAQLDQVELMDWAKVFEQVSAKAEFAQEPESKSEQYKATLFPPIDINLNLSALNNPLVKLNTLELALHRTQKENWVVGFNGEFGNGILRIHESQPWQLDIESLKLELLDPVPPDSPPVESAEGIFTNPNLWPTIDILCHQCVIAQQAFGEISATLRTITDGLSLSGRIINKSQHDLRYELRWRQASANESSVSPGQNNELTTINADSQRESSDTTSIDFYLKTGDLGKLLKRWHYPVGIKDSGAQISGHINWPDTPWNFEAMTIQGATRFRLGEGYLSELSDAQARLFSLFNLQSLTRKLRLDFKDVYKKGFFYNKLNGDVTLQDGLVFTDNVFIEGNAANVGLAGSVDLKNERIEQVATVIPQLTSSLPVLVGWAVEPTTGILVYLLNKLVEPAIDVVTQIEYRIHGDLDDIQVDQISRRKAKVKVELPKEQPEQQPVESENDKVLPDAKNVDTGKVSGKEATSEGALEKEPSKKTKREKVTQKKRCRLKIHKNIKNRPKINQLTRYCRQSVGSNRKNP